MSDAGDSAFFRDDSEWESELGGKSVKEVNIFAKGLLGKHRVELSRWMVTR